MNKLRVIDLLNKIANGEENDLETEFVFNGEIFNFYKFKNQSGYCLDGWLLNQEIKITKSLNDEVEIIEEDKNIEEIDMFDYFTGNDYGGTNKKLLTDLEYNFVKLNSKINEIIDYINKENKE